MNISWRLQRQILIFTTYFLIATLPFIYIVSRLLSQSVSCFDGKQNGDETAVDCGGSCNLRCDGTYKSLKVNFTRVLKSDENRYDVFALIENFNPNISFPKVPYNASIYSSEGILLLSASGTISVNPSSQAVVYLPNLEMRQIPKIIDFNLSKHNAILQINNNPNRINVNTWTSQKGVNNTLQLIGELVNPFSSSANNVSIYALLYDDTRTVYAVGKTKIKSLKGREKTAIAYTWGDLPKPTNVEFVLVYDE
jgi:hypothetical protein